MLFNPSIVQRFWAKVDKDVPGGCWLWTASLDRYGYGQFNPRPHITITRGAHRYAYELIIGPIPAQLTLDHLCRVRHCVNPDHLEPVSMKENVLRGIGLTAKQARLTHCKRGHPFDLFNTYHAPNDDRRYCRQCRAEDHQRRAPNRREYFRDYMREKRAALHKS